MGKRFVSVDTFDVGKFKGVVNEAYDLVTGEGPDISSSLD